MSAPERIWAHPTERNPVNKAWHRGKWKDHDSGASGDAGYIHEVIVAEMIRQAVADAEAKALRMAADELKGQGYNTAVRQILALIAKPIMSGDDTGR